MLGLEAETVKWIRAEYPKGTRLRLVRMDVGDAPQPGTTGTVTGVDESGMIHVRWDDGSCYPVDYEEDEFDCLIDPGRDWGKV